MISVAELIELLKKQDPNLPVVIPLLGYDVDGYELLNGVATIKKVSMDHNSCVDYEERHVGATYEYAEKPGIKFPMWDAHLDVLVIE